MYQCVRRRKHGKTPHSSTISFLERGWAKVQQLSSSNEQERLWEKGMGNAALREGDLKKILTSAFSLSSSSSLDGGLLSRADPACSLHPCDQLQSFLDIPTPTSLPRSAFINNSLTLSASLARRPQPIRLPQKKNTPSPT